MAKSSLWKTDKIGLCKIVLLSVLFKCNALLACGISLERPVSHFDGVDFQGHINFVTTLASIQVGRKNLPIYLIFNSGSRLETPYGGVVDVPLLTSRIEQTDDSEFVMRSPTGWIIPFLRRADNPLLLDGGSGMKAVIDEKSQMITAWAACGDKLTFVKGHITEWKTSDCTLKYIYLNNRISEIRVNDAAVLRILPGPTNDVIGGISLGDGKNYSFEWDKRPVVENNGERSIVSGFSKAIHKISSPGGGDLTMEFSVDSNVQPVLVVNNQDRYSWNPKTLSAVAVNRWYYEVSPVVGRLANAAITRRDGDRSEYWFYDGPNCRETARSIDGIETSREWFRSGPLAGKTRSEKFTQNGKVIRMLTNLYNEQGRVAQIIDRREDAVKKTNFLYDPSGTLTRITSKVATPDRNVDIIESPGRFSLIETE